MQEGSGLVTTGAPQACDDAWELLLHDQANWFVPQAPAADVQKEGEYVERQVNDESLRLSAHCSINAVCLPTTSFSAEAESISSAACPAQPTYFSTNTVPDAVSSSQSAYQSRLCAGFEHFSGPYQTRCTGHTKAVI